MLLSMALFTALVPFAKVKLAPIYTGYVSSIYRPNRNVVFSCKYRVVWCPKYRRSVLVDGADEALKRIF